MEAEGCKCNCADPEINRLELRLEILEDEVKKNIAVSDFMQRNYQDAEMKS